jgi:hypothetical protein
MEQSILPHGAKGIEGDEFAVEFRHDKVVFIVKSDGAGKHYTLQAGLKSGVIDLHETHPETNERRTLYAIQRDAIPALMGESAAILPELLGLLRPLRLGWMKHRNIGIARGIDPVSDEDIAAVTRKRRSRLTIDPELHRQNIVVPEYLEDVYDFPDGNFSLIYRNRPIGLGFKATNPDGEVRLFWIKYRDLECFSREWRKKMGEMFERLAIPPERYPEYPFLTP